MKTLQDLEVDKRKHNIKHDVSNLSLSEKFSFYRMAIKYWWAGDDWLFAQEYALSLIRGFKR